MAPWTRTSLRCRIANGLAVPAEISIRPSYLIRMRSFPGGFTVDRASSALPPSQSEHQPGTSQKSWPEDPDPGEKAESSYYCVFSVTLLLYRVCGLDRERKREPVLVLLFRTIARPLPPMTLHSNTPYNALLLQRTEYYDPYGGVAGSQATYLSTSHSSLSLLPPPDPTRCR